MDILENSGIVRRTFVRRLALASGGLGLAGAGACAQTETGTLVKGMAARMPGSMLVTFDDSGHSPYWEIPDRFNAVVLDFLRG